MNGGGGDFLVVKLAAAGDVLLATALLAELRRARPHAHIGWLVSPYAAPLLERNPDLDDLLPVPALAHGCAARARAAARWLPLLRRWRRAHPRTTVLLAHRAPALALLLRAAGFRRIIGFENAGFDNGFGIGLSTAAPWRLERSRLDQQADLLRAADVVVNVAVDDGFRLAPRLCLGPEELAVGERVWGADAARRPRWVISAGGASNPWSAMPNRRWPPERFLELGRRALAAGIAVRWLGGPADVPLVRWIAARLPGGVETADYAGRLPLRHAAAAIAVCDLVIGNDSLPLVLAEALGRPGLGLYGPTAGAAIHAPGRPFLQGRAGCGPCYDPRHGVRGRAYRCPRARCMEHIAVDEVWRLAQTVSPTVRLEFAHA